MSIITALTKRSPQLNGVEFDATIESTLSASVDITTYPMESGARAADHALVNPIEYSMTIMASNNPLRPQVTDFIGGAISNVIDLPTIAGLSSGFLSGRPDTHAAAVLTMLLTQMVERQVMDVYGGDIHLSSMLIISIERTRTPENENGLECVVTLQELPTLDLIQGRSGLDNIKTDPGDQASTSAGRYIHKGVAKVQEAGAVINEAASDVFFHIGASIGV